MTERVHIAFEDRIVTLPISSMLPRKKLPDGLAETQKYRSIAKSIAEIGLIEPLVVARLTEHDTQFLLLDGHVRLAILTELGQEEVQCVVSDDDEALTYNKRVNRLATVQENFMLLRALEQGVSEEKLAKALNVNVSLIKRRRTLLDGICPEVVERFKDKAVNPGTFDVLRKMKPMRQIESTELMLTAANWTRSYAKALLAATRQEDLAKPDQPKKVAGLTHAQMARMEREMTSLHRDFKQIERSYGEDILILVIACGYLGKLVGNSEVEKFLSQYHSEILQEFRSIIAATSLDQGIAA